MSSLASLANLFDTPVHVMWRGVAFYAKASIKLAPAVANTRIMSDSFGSLGARKGDASITVELELVGEWEAAALALLHPYTTMARGTPIGITRLRCAQADLNTTSNRLTIASHGRSDGDLCYLGTTGAFPTLASGSLAAGTAYYVKSIDTDTVELYTDSGLTTIVDFSAAGTGSLLLSFDNALDLYLLAYGGKLTLHNAALVGIPDVQAGAASTPLGTAKFEAFVRQGYTPGTANSYWTYSEGAWSDTGFDPAAVLTQPLTVAFGSTSPFSDLDVAEAVKVSFALKTGETRSDRHGLVGRKLDDIDITATLKPRGLNAYQALTQLALQGAARGSTISMGTLNLSGSGFYLRLYDTALEQAPHEFGAGADLHGDFTIRGLRTVTTGAADARYYVGTSAPA